MLEREESLISMLSKVANVDFSVSVAETPFSTEELAATNYWFLPPSRENSNRAKTMRKHIFSSLISLMTQVVRHQPDLIIGFGQGGVIALLAALPMVLETACRSRINSEDTIREYRQA